MRYFKYSIALISTLKSRTRPEAAMVAARLGHTILAAALAAHVAARPQHVERDADWHQYVRSPSSEVVKPARIIERNTTGNVQNANGLITGNGATVLTRANVQDTAPTIIVDFGQNVVGLLTIDFAKSTNGSDTLPGIRLAFSETLQFLGDRGDFTRSDNAGGVSTATQEAINEAS